MGDGSQGDAAAPVLAVPVWSPKVPMHGNYPTCCKSSTALSNEALEVQGLRGLVVHNTLSKRHVRTQALQAPRSVGTPIRMHGRALMVTAWHRETHMKRKLSTPSGMHGCGHLE